MTPSFTRFLDHTQRRTTVDKTPLDEWSARRRDLYLTTHKTHNRQTSMSPGGIRTHNLSRRLAAGIRLRLRGHWDRLNYDFRPYIYSHKIAVNHLNSIVQPDNLFGARPLFEHPFQLKGFLIASCVSRNCRLCKFKVTEFLVSSLLSSFQGTSNAGPFVCIWYRGSKRYTESTDLFDHAREPQTAKGCDYLNQPFMYSDEVSLLRIQMSVCGLLRTLFHRLPKISSRSKYSNPSPALLGLFLEKNTTWTLRERERCWNLSAPFEVYCVFCKCKKYDNIQGVHIALHLPPREETEGRDVRWWTSLLTPYAPLISRPQISSCGSMWRIMFTKTSLDVNVTLLVRVTEEIFRCGERYADPCVSRTGPSTWCDQGQ